MLFQIYLSLYYIVVCSLNMVQSSPSLLLHYHYRYNDFVRSALINYCAHTSQDIALRYNYGSANIQVGARSAIALKYVP